MDTGRALVGTSLVAVGGLLLLDQAGAVDAGDVLSTWWPVVFLVAATLDLLARPARPVSATVFALLGLALLSNTTGVLDASVWSLVWPTAILLLGLWLLFRRPMVGSPSGAAAGGSTGLAVGGEVRSVAPDIEATAFFSGRRVVNTGQPFRRGSATALFGGVEIDLSGAVIDGEASLDLVAMFGGVDVTVPLGWRVILDGPAIFGGHESHVPAPSDPDAPTLRVRATAVFGGVDVKAVHVPAPRPDLTPAATG